MSADSTSRELPDDIAVQSPAAKRREELRKASTRAALKMNLATGGFFLIVLGCLIFEYWLAMRMAHRPQVQSMDLEHVSLQDWTAQFHIDFPDKGLPVAVRKQDAAHRQLPTAIVGGQDRSIPVARSQGKTPARLGLKFFVPEGALPGVYSGTLVVADAKGRLPEQKLPLVIEVLDPLEKFRWLLAYFAAVTALLLLGVLWFNPLPFGCVRTLLVERSYQEPASRIGTTDIFANHRGKVMMLVLLACYGALFYALRKPGAFDLASPSGLRWLAGGTALLAVTFLWTDPFGRKRVPLQSIDSTLPEGEIEFTRTGLLGGRNRISAVVRFWDEAMETMKVTGEWPRSVLELETAAAAPGNLGIQPRRPLGLQDIFAKPMDDKGQRVICFQVLREPPQDDAL